MRRAADIDCLILAGLRIEHRHLLRPAPGDPQFPIGREGDVIRAAGNRVAADRRQRRRIERCRRAADAVVDPDDLAVRRDEQVVRALAGVDTIDHTPIRRIDHGDIVRAHVGDQHLAVVPQHARRRLADLRGPQDRQPAEVDRHQAVGALQADEHARGIRRVVQMARHRGGREALQQLHARGVVDIDLIAREAIHHEEPAVRAECQLIRIGHRHALLQRAGRRIEEQHLVADGVADQQAFAVGTECDVMRLAQHRNAAEFLLRRHVHQADRGAARS